MRHISNKNEKSLETKRFQGFCVAGVVRLELTARGFGGHVKLKRTVQIVPTVEPFVLLGLLNLMPFDALLMLLKILCKFDAQLPKNDARNFI